MEIIEFEDTQLNPKEKVREKIIERIKLNDGYCPCVAQLDSSTKCPCVTYLESHNCHCNLYIKK